MASFDEFDMFSFFGMETPEKEEPKPTPVTTTADDEDDYDLSVTTEDSESSASKAAAVASPKKGKGIVGKTALKEDVCVYGRNFMKAVTLDELESKTYDGLVKKLYADGFKTVALSATDIAVVGNSIFVIEPTSASDSDNAVTFPESGSVTVCDGMLQAEITAATLGKDADEVSVDDLLNKWVEVNPSYEGCGMHYFASVGIATPVFKDTVKSVKLPAIINVCGNDITLTTDDFPSTNEVTAEQVFTQQVPVDVKGLDFSFGATSEDGHYVLVVKRGKATSVTGIDKGSFTTVKNVKSGKVEEKYTLPFLLVATSSDQRVTVTPEMFDGKEKVKQEDVLSLLSKDKTSFDPQLIGFKIYSASDKQFNFVYGEADGNRKLVVSAVSGKKG